MLPTITGEFRAVADPSLRFTPAGMAVADVRVAANSRKKDDSGEWVDDKVVWLTVTAFKKMAENMAESVVKGSLISVTGRLQTEDWETKEGEKRQTYRVLADTVAMSLAFDAAIVQKAERKAAEPRGEDPWAAPPSSDEPPF